MDVVGLRMVAPAPERAVAQWGELLGGALEEHPGALVFRWDGSPMRVCVRLDAACEAASEAIEIDAARDLPTGVPPGLGVRFERPLAP